MKRKNILWGFVLLLVAMAFCYACTSCGDDKQEEPQPGNPLLGAWEAVIDEAKSQQLEQTIVNYLAQNGQLTQETIDALNRVKEIVATTRFVVQFNSDGTARLYAYRGGVAPFVTGSWTLTEQALILKVGTLQLPVTNLQTDGTTLHCTVADLPMTFTRYSNK